MENYRHGYPDVPITALKLYNTFIYTEVSFFSSALSGLKIEES
jgi:hypothetical protein